MHMIMLELDEGEMQVIVKSVALNKINMLVVIQIISVYYFIFIIPNNFFLLSLYIHGMPTIIPLYCHSRNL